MDHTSDRFSGICRVGRHSGRYFIPVGLNRGCRDDSVCLVMASLEEEHSNGTKY